MKFRICVIAVMLIASAALAVRAVRLSKQDAVKTQEATVTIRNNTKDNRWTNVPIQISSLGGYDYKITNASGMPIKRFILAIYAAFPGVPVIGPGSKRHYSPVRVTDKPIPVGQSIEINIAENIREFSSKQHEHADMSRVEIWPELVEFDYDPLKSWRGGVYFRSTGKGEWEEDPDLNPKANKNLVGAPSTSAGCFVYEPPPPQCLPCSTGDPVCDSGTACRLVIPRFKSVFRTGVHRTTTCGYRCTLLNAQGQCDEFGTQCAHGDGTPCEVLIDDLNYDDPCN